MNRLASHARVPSEYSQLPNFTEGGYMYKLDALILCTALACSSLSVAQPVRKYDDKGAPPFKVLKEGENPPLDAYDNFVIGPKYVTAPERKVVDGRSTREGRAVRDRFEGNQAPESGHCSQAVRKGRSGQPEDADRRDSQHRLQACDHGLHSRAIQTGNRSAVHGGPRRPRLQQESQVEFADHPR